MARYLFQKWVFDSTEVPSVQTTVQVGLYDLNLTAYYAPEVTSDFNISASPPSQSVSVGASTTFNVATSPISGVQSNVALAVTGLPVNTTYAFSPASGTPPFSSTLTVQTAQNTPAGTYQLTISAFGSVARSTTVTLIVNPPAPFDFTISASPVSQPVTVGNQTTFAVSTVLAAGYTEPVTLAVVSGLPPSASASFSPTQGNPPFSSTLTIQTSANTPTGSYTMTITGIGSVDRSTSVTLVVNPVQVQRGTILVSAKIGTGVIANASGQINDSTGSMVASFTATPFSWDQAVVGTEYTVVCRVEGYADQTLQATVQAEGASVPASFQFALEAGFPLWVVVAVGGTLAVVAIFSRGGGKGKKKK